MTGSDADVLVVGAGPVGMTAALALATRGLTVTVIERASTTSDAPKAISLDDESLRLFQSIGIVDEILRIIVPGTGTAYYGADGDLLFLARGPRPYRFGFPFKNPFAQPDLERVLHDAMLRNPRIDAHFDSEFVDLVQHSERVHATVRGRSGTHVFSAGYLIGADGGRSTVRRQVSVRMKGQSFDDVWLVVDTLGDRRRERYGMHHGDPERPHVIVPGLHGRCRYEFRLTAKEAADVGAEPPFSLIHQLVARYRALEPSQVERAVAYTFHALCAEKWRVGRVFLVGDAAHMMPPFAGQGLNSGIRDVANLSWKLTEAVLSTRGETFLDSYELERRPHAEAVTKSSVRLGRVVMTTNRRVARRRDQGVRAVLRTAEGRSYFEQMRYRPENRLSAGLVRVDSGIPTVGTQLGQPFAFDFESRTVQPLDTILGPDWAVLAVGVEPAAVRRVIEAASALTARIVAVPLDDLIDEYDASVRVAIDVDNGLYTELEHARGRFLLVRPDRMIALDWLPGDESAVAAHIDAWLGHDARAGSHLRQPAERTDALVPQKEIP